MAERIYRVIVFLAALLFLTAVSSPLWYEPFGTDLYGNKIERTKAEYIRSIVGASIPLFLLLAGSYIARGRFFGDPGNARSKD